MVFTHPEWNPSTNSYKIQVLRNTNFQYTETRLRGSNNFYDNVNIENNEFVNVLNKVADALYNDGSNWFASPIKQSIFLKRVKHTFETPNKNGTYGNTVEFTWEPHILNITPKSFELEWIITKNQDLATIIPSNFIDVNEELEPRTIVVQTNEIIENAEIPFDTSEIPVQQISSRAVLKKKVRHARLKAAIATMKAEKLAEKYFRRYGIETELDNESQLSFDSEEEDSEEE